MRVDKQRVLISLASVPAVALFAAGAASANPDPVLPPDPAVPVATDPLVPLNVVANPAPAVDAAVGSELPITPPPNGTPHLASPDALPPGSTMVDQDTDSPNVSYLKDLRAAVQNGEISRREAFFMGIAQRGMNTPYPELGPGPNRPSAPVDPAAVPPPPAG